MKPDRIYGVPVATTGSDSVKTKAIADHLVGLSYDTMPLPKARKVAVRIAAAAVLAAKVQYGDAL